MMAASQTLFKPGAECPIDRVKPKGFPNMTLNKISRFYVVTMTLLLIGLLQRHAHAADLYLNFFRNP